MTGTISTELAPGTRIADYVLAQPIGNPNMGEVWLAWPANNPRTPVAIKTLHPRHQDTAAMHDRFAAECATHRSLTHPGIVPALDCFLCGRRLYLVMPFAAEGSLEDRLQRGPLDLAEALPMAITILEALNYTHQRGFVHRDVKPSNILLQGGRAFLTDFGVACQFPQTSPTRADSSGTAAYMSPEQIQAPHTVDQRSDVYGFACVLYEMLTGRPPFPLNATETCTDDQLKIMHLTQAPIPPRKLRPALDRRLENVLLQALEKAPARRLPGCGSFALALRNLFAAVN